MNAREDKAKLYMSGAAQRNLTRRVQVDEISGSVVRMFKGAREGIQAQLGSSRSRPIETGVYFMTTGWKAILASGILMGAALLSWAGSGQAQAKGTPSGLISGTVTANREYALSEASGN